MSDQAYKDHLISVDVSVMLTDPSLASLDPNGPAAAFLGRIAAATAYYDHSFPPTVFVRTQALPKKGASPIAHLPPEGAPQ